MDFYRVFVVSLWFILTVVWHETAALFTDQWAVRINGGEKVAREVADRHGFTYVAKIMDDYYLFRHRRISKRSVIPSSEFDETFENERQVLWAQQQQTKRRVKRNVQALFNDPKWPRMWYLNRGGGLDMNVIPAWRKGYTGKGVVVSILDDGVEKDHPDLKHNYDGGASYDVNDQDPDPQPRYEYSNENRHGTRCAGVVAAEANNGICTIGVAYEARIGGVRMLDGDVTDAVEAQSLSLNRQYIDIYSVSWGPDDDGQTVDGPGPLARKAFTDGILHGRRGLGSIFVWASGNGGRDGDSCNCDGYTNSIYTLSISSATENGHVPWYSEACSSTLATTYSSGSGSERQIVTTDLRKGCTESHTGTSVSAPLSAGIYALVLQANPYLTWRDLQHIVVMTARKANLEADDWIVNGVKRRVSHHFGYGLLDVGAMVNLARNWTNVPEQRRCEIVSRQASRGIPVNGNIEVALESDGCRGSSSHVVYLEHVQAIVTLSASRRGEVEVFLTSPEGTRSTLLARRLRDTSTEGFNAWAFMTTHSWGEHAAGTWRLEVRNGASIFYQARLSGWTLVMYGTDNHPYRKRLTSTTVQPTAALNTIPTRPHPPPPPPPLPVAVSWPLPLPKYLPEKTVKLGPCRKPPVPSLSRFTSARTTAAAAAAAATTRQLTSAVLPSAKATLKSWSLLLYGVTTQQPDNSQNNNNNNVWMRRKHQPHEGYPWQSAQSSATHHVHLPASTTIIFAFLLHFVKGPTFISLKWYNVYS